MYPGNVLILDRAARPCQDVSSTRVDFSRAVCARPGTFPRFTILRKSRIQSPVSSAIWRYHMLWTLHPEPRTAPHDCQSTGLPDGGSP